MLEQFYNIAKKLNDIFAKGDLNRGEEVADIIMGMDLKREIDETFMSCNKELIKNAYYLTVSLYGKKATIDKFNTLINNVDGKGAETIIKLSKELNHSPETENVISWFIINYFKSDLTGEITYVSHYHELTRYLVNIMRELIYFEKLVLETGKRFNMPELLNTPLFELFPLFKKELNNMDSGTTSVICERLCTVAYELDKKDVK